MYNYCMFVRPDIEQKDFPFWVQILGWLIAVSPVLLCILAGFTHAIFKANGPMKVVSTITRRTKYFAPNVKFAESLFTSFQHTLF